MASRSKGSKQRRFGWRRPRSKDPAFWAAVAIAAVAIALQVLIADDRSDPLTWLSLAVRALVTWFLVSAVIRIRVGIRRGLVEGFAEAEVRAEHRSSGQSTPETLARVSGRTVGRAVGAYKRAQRSKRT
jgi:hypothetical protein